MNSAKATNTDTAVSQPTVSVVLTRHTQSQWNLENRFTGWDDPPLTVVGVAEAERAG